MDTYYICRALEYWPAPHIFQEPRNTQITVVQNNSCLLSDLVRFRQVTGTGYTVLVFKANDPLEQMNCFTVSQKETKLRTPTNATTTTTQGHCCYKSWPPCVPHDELNEFVKRYSQ